MPARARPPSIPARLAARAGRRPGGLPAALAAPAADVAGRAQVRGSADGMNLHRYDLEVPLDGLVDDTRRAVEGWDWSRGAYGHALSLPAYRQLHPYARYGYENYPCAGLLEELPRAASDLRRPGVREGLLPAAAPRARLRVRLAHRPLEGRGSGSLPDPDRVRPAGVPGHHRLRERGSARGPVVAAAERRSPSQPSRTPTPVTSAGTRLEPGRLHYFDTTRVHTLVNPGPSERITLSFDLVANDWLLARFPAIRG